MVKDVLTAAGFVEGKTFEETQFIKAPRETYTIYNDSFIRRGADYHNLIKEHSVSIELYSYKPDPNAEARIEQSFDLFGIEYEKQERTWLNNEQLYLVVYDFDYVEK